MFQYKVENLRRISETPWISIHPITILVGRNSAGKSSFLRSFPLFKQSIDVKSSAPILWYEQDGVDFGDFETALHSEAINKEIIFSFGIDSEKRREVYNNSWFRGNSNASYQYFRFLSPPYEEFENPHFTISYHLKPDGKKTARSLIKIQYQGAELVIDPTSEEITVRTSIDHSFNATKKLGIRARFIEKHIFSDVSYAKNTQQKSTETIYLHRRLMIAECIYELIESDLKGKLSDQRIVQLVNSLMELRSFDTSVMQKGVFELKTVQALISKIDNKNAEKKRSLNEAIELNFLLKCFERAGKFLSDTMRNVRYIGPARVKSERYYRQQELYVSEISPDGRNLPMFLASLTDGQRRSFSNWVQNIFGYGIKFQNQTGHISIAIESNGKVVNAVDTGYGVSQILPVLAQIWWFSRSATNHRRGSTILTIEQPELHLHPAHQALISDILVETIKESESKRIQYIIETHSESLINRLGELISEGEIKKDDVNIIIFSSDGELETPKISTASFDDDGVLSNWPFGFFNYD